MSINPNDLISEIIIPALSIIGLKSDEAIAILLGTAGVESHLGTFLRQLDGPALGIYQMEPETHDDIWDNYLKYNVRYTNIILTNFGCRDANKMIYDLRYATIMARLKYYRSPKLLPDKNDIEGQAKIWKDVYNTILGKGDTDKYVLYYNTYIKGYINF